MMEWGTGNIEKQQQIIWCSAAAEWTVTTILEFIMLP